MRIGNISCRYLDRRDPFLVYLKPSVVASGQATSSWQLAPAKANPDQRLESSKSPFLALAELIAKCYLLTAQSAGTASDVSADFALSFPRKSTAETA